MGRYIEWDDVIDRYPELNTVSGADEMAPAFINYAESWVDGMLSSHFTPPFSNNNMVIRDIVIDNVYYRAGRFKLDNANQVWSDTLAYIEMLKSGDANMVTQSGDVLDTRASGAIYSSTQSYHSAFGMDDPIDWSIDTDQQDADKDSRD